MAVNRRFILKSLGFGTAAWILQPNRFPLVHAEPKAPERFFIFCYFSGGWDTLISLDPRDPHKFNESNMNDTKIQPGYDRLDGDMYKQEPIMPKGSNIMFGPAMEPFARHFDVSCVVRGTAMDTVSHTVGRRYFITGMMPRGQNAVGSSISTWLVAEQGELTSIPNLVVGVEAYNRKSPAFATGLQVNGVGGLLETLRYSNDVPSGELGKILEDYRALNENCDPVDYDQDGLMSLINTSQKSARVLVSQNLGRFFDFNSRSPEMQAIKKRYGITNTGGGAAQAAMAFQAIKQGVAQSVTIHLAGGLDTHGSNWATDQTARQYAGFKALATLVDDLKATKHPSVEGKSLLDATTILCFSEFSRTPLLNGGSGRDHWLASSCLLVGAGVPHNKVVGATSDKGFNPMAVDPKTGETTKAGGVLVTPTRIAASMLESAGYSSDVFRVSGLPCLKA